MQNRAVMIWSGYTEFTEVLNKLPKLKQPQEKSFPILQEAIKYRLIPDKLKLNDFISSKLNSFLEAFKMISQLHHFLVMFSKIF